MHFISCSGALPDLKFASKQNLMVICEFYFSKSQVVMFYMTVTFLVLAKLNGRGVIYCEGLERQAFHVSDIVLYIATHNNNAVARVLKQSKSYHKKVIISCQDFQKLLNLIAYRKFVDKKTTRFTY
jgi:hypothetical protein